MGQVAGTVVAVAVAAFDGGLTITCRYFGFVFAIGPLSLDTDLITVEVVGLLAAFAFFVGPVMYLCQGFVAVGIGVDIGISAVRLDFLQDC